MSTHKYSTDTPSRFIDATHRWEKQADDRPHFSDHALERWDDRTPDDAVSPETAWERGIDADELRMEVFADADGRAPDRVRVYGTAEFSVAFLVANGNVLTVYRPEWIDNGAVRAYLFALLDGDRDV